MKVIREWVDDAACLGMDQKIFFPTQSFLGYIQDLKTEAAKMVCERCPVSDECLDDAIRMRPSDDVAGIRGGLTADERLEYRKEHGIEPDPNWNPPRTRGQQIIELPSGLDVL